jgi:signal transduction histidine kinase
VSLKVRTGRDPPNRRLKIVAGLSAAAFAVCAAAVAITLSGSQSSNPAVEAQIRALIIAAPIAVGLFVWYRDPWRRFGKLLVAAGFAWSLTTLAQSSNEVLYSAGRVVGWLVEPLLIYLVLAFPSGRLTTRPARFLVAASVLLVLLFYLPTTLLVDGYPTPSPWTSCQPDCPSNAFMLLGSEPGFIPDVIVPLREAATMVLFAGVITVLATRIRHGSHLRRITLVPVLTVAIIHALALIGGIAARRIAPGASSADVLASIAALSSGGVALGFLAGLSGWRLFESRALRRLATAFATHPPALTLHETSELLSGAMDPSLEVFFRPRDQPDAWLDTRDRPSTVTVKEDVRCVTEVLADDGRVVAVVHDMALSDAPTLLDVAGSSVLKALENDRLFTELRSSLRELRDSRARIMSGADRERQRIERDLHDGAQQSLVALRIRLQLAGELLQESPARAEQLLSELDIEVDQALEQVRSLARGVYPSLLADLGLRDALRAAALRNPVRTTVDVDGLGRYPPEIETAIYFCCLEAMQNAMKHAAGVETISVSLAARGDLRFEIRDDGAGFAEKEVPSGAGLLSMRDRLEAIGGVLTIFTAPGAGTRVSGAVPLAANGSSHLNGAHAAVQPAVVSLGNQPSDV